MGLYVLLPSLVSAFELLKQEVEKWKQNNSVVKSLVFKIFFLQSEKGYIH